MKKLYAKLISLIFTGVLLAACTTKIDDLATFGTALFWILVLATLFAHLTMVVSISKFDEGDLDKEKAESIFKPFHNRNWFDKLFSSVMSILNISLLILISSPILAAVYTLTSLISIKLTASAKRRYIKAQQD